MLSRIVCKNSVYAESPRKHVELSRSAHTVQRRAAASCFRGDVAQTLCLHMSRESMAPMASKIVYTSCIIHLTCFSRLP